MYTKNILNSFKTKLIDVIGDDVSSRVVENIARQNTPLPLVTYQIISFVPQYYFTNDNHNFLFESRIQVTVYNYTKNGISDTRDLSDTIIEGLNGEPVASLDPSGGDDFSYMISCQDMGRLEISEDIVSISLDFMLKGSNRN